MNSYDQQFEKPLYSQYFNNLIGNYDLSELSKIGSEDVTPIDIKGMEELPGLLDPYTRNLQAERAAAQPGYAQAGSAVGRVLVNTIPTIIGNIASIVDIEDYYNQDNEVGNAITNAMEEFKANVNQNYLPIYRRSDEPLDIGDPGWWWENGSSLAESALSFAATGYGVGALLGGLSKTGKFGQTAATLLNAVALNQAESIQFASGVYKDTYQSELDKLSKDPSIQLTPDEIESQAKQSAADAASLAVNINRANILLNITSAGMFIKPPQLTRQLIKKHATGDVLKEILGEGAQEAAEETINLVAEKEGRRLGEMGDKYSMTLSNIIDEAFTKEGLESAILGAVGGMAQTGITKSFTRGMSTEERRRYDEQQARISDHQSILESNHIPNMVDVFDSAQRQAAYQADMDNALADGNDEKYTAAQDRMLSNIAYNAFKSGTTESLEDTFNKIGQLTDEQAAKKGLDIDTKSPTYYKTKAREAVDKIKKMENLYNKYNPSQYFGDTQVDIYNNRIDNLNLIEHSKELDSKIATTRSDIEDSLRSQNKSFFNDKGDISSEAKQEPLYKQYSQLLSQKEKVGEAVSLNNQQFKDLTSDEYQSKAKKNIENLIKKRIQDKLNADKESAINEVDNAQSAEQIQESIETAPNETVRQNIKDAVDQRTEEFQQEVYDDTERVGRDLGELISTEPTVAESEVATEQQIEEPVIPKDFNVNDHIPEGFQAEEVAPKVEYPEGFQAEEVVSRPEIEEGFQAEQPEETVNWARRRYSKEGGSAAFVGELGKLKDSLNKLEGTNDDIDTQIGNLASAVTNPEQMDRWLQGIVDAQKRGEDVGPLLQAIKSFFNNINTKVAQNKANEQVKQNINVPQPEITNNEVNDELLGESYDENKHGNTGNKYSVDRTGLKKAKDVQIAIDVEGLDVDKNGLDNYDYQVGQKVYIEIDKTNDYNPENADERGFRLVVYKDGNTSNKSKSNRKIIGSLTSTKKGGKASDDLANLRKMVHEDIQSRYDQEGDIITSKYYTVITGFFSKYTRSSQRNSPLSIVRDQDKSAHSRDGGVTIGYVKNINGIMTIIAPSSKVIDDISMSRNSSVRNGEIYIITQNPLMKDTLIMRGFVKKLSKYAKEQPDRAKAIRTKVLNEIAKLNPDGSNFTEVKRNVRKYLIFDMTYDASSGLIKSRNLTASLSDIKSKKLGDINKIIVDGIFNIDANLLNKLNQVVDLGYEAVTGNYNELIDQFLEVTTLPQKPLDTVAPLVDTAIRTAEEVVNAEVVKEIVSDKDPELIDESVASDPKPVKEVEPVMTPESGNNGADYMFTGFDDVSDLDISDDELNNIANKFDQFTKLKTPTAEETSNKTKWNEDEEIAWLNKNLPQVPKSVVPNIKEIIANGPEAWGVFHNAAIYISKEAGVGTAYHEAFHAVFNMFLNESEQNEILKYGSEEDLADQFADYVISQVEDKSISKRVRDFFRKLLLTIKSFVGSDIKNLDEMFFKMNNGFYVNSKIKNSKFANVADKYKVPGWTQERTKEATSSINNYMITEVLPRIRKQYTKLANLNDAQLLSALSAAKGSTFTYKLVANDLLKLSKIRPEKAVAINELITKLFNQDGTPGKLFYDSIRTLDYSHGIKVSERAVKQTEPDGAAQTDVLDNEVSFKENWMDNFTERSRKNNAPYQIKAFINNMKTGKANWIGLPEYVNNEDIYDTLLDKMSNLIDIDDMKAELEKLSSGKNPLYPEFKQILDEMEVNKVFETTFFQAFNNHHAKYGMVYEKNGNYVLTESNRRGVVNNIINKWNSSVLTDSEVVSRDETGKGIIDQVKAQQLKNEFDSIVRDWMSSKNPLTDTQASQLENITRKFGFTIEAKVFIYADLNKRLTELLHSGKEGRSISMLINRFAEGKNPFDASTGLDGSESAAIKAIARIVKIANPSLYESAFRNADGKTVYSHLIHNFTSRMMAKFHNPEKLVKSLEFYRQDALYNNNVILDELDNALDSPGALEDVFDFMITDALRDKGENPVSYANMTEAEQQTFAISAYFNNGNKDNAYYLGPVLSDAPNMILFKFKRFSESEAMQHMLQLASNEYLRIQALKGDNNNPIKNYNTDANSSTDTGYHIMPMFNGQNQDPLANREKSIKLIHEYIQEKVESYYKSLVKNGVIVENANGSVNFKDSKVSTKLSTKGDFKKYLSEMYHNDFLMRASFSILTVGDPAFYKADSKSSNKRVVDYFKRAKEIWSPALSPALSPDLHAVYTTKSGELIKVSPTYNTIYIKDEEIKAPSYNEIEKALIDAGVSQSKRTSILSSYNNVNHADAQAYITLPFYRETMVGYARWTDRHQDAYDRLIDGKGTANDFALFAQPMKPFVYGQIFDNLRRRIIPVQNKNSEYLLLPQFTAKNPKLDKLRKHMEDNKIGVANFESAVKAGLSGVASIDNVQDATIHTLNMEDRGIQQEVPEHFVDASNLFGTQIRKLIMADLDPNIDYTIAGAKSMKAKEYQKLYEDIIIADLTESYQNVRNEFLNDDNSLNWKKISNILIDEIRSRGKGEELEDAVSYNEETGKLNLPLFHPIHAVTSQNLLTSIFKTRITKQKIAGGSFVQLSSVGLADNLKIVTNENGGIQYAQVLLPAWSKKFFNEKFYDKNGEVDFDKVSEAAPEILDMIGYRIPTEDKYSMMPLKVVGFLPIESGSSIMLPAEITTISGSDFDVDKMFVMMKEFKDVDGKFEAIKYDWNKDALEQSQAARNNAKIDMMLGVLRNHKTLEAMLTPGGFEGLRSIKDAIVNQEGEGKTDLDVMDLGSVHELSIRNMTGKQLVGIAANHNAHHALRQHSNLSLKNPIEFDGESLSMLNEKKAVTSVTFDKKGLPVISKNPGTNISRNLAEFLAAVVDNAKDPLASYLNYNTVTADIISLITSVGYDPATAVIFAKQPVVVEFTRRMLSEKNASVHSVISKLIKDTGTDATERPVSVNTNEMFNYIGKTDIGDSYQQNILNVLNSIAPMAKDLGKLIRCSTSDTKGLGPTIADGEVIIEGVEDIVTSYDFGINGAASFLTKSEGSSNFVSAFTEFGLKLPITEILNHVYPYGNSNGLYMAIKSKINEDLGDRDLSADQRNKINNTIMTGILSQFDYFNMEERNSIINDFPIELMNYIKDNPEIKSNALISRLDLDAKDDTTPIDRIVFANPGSLTDGQKTNIMQSFDDLFNDSKHNEIAHKLVKYSYFSTGLMFTPNSFAHLIPLEAYTSHMKNSNGNTISDVLNSMDTESWNATQRDAFIDQFHKNNYDNQSFNPRVKDDMSNITTSIEENGIITSFLIDPSNVTDRSLINGSKKNPSPKRFISHKLDNEINLYKFVGYESGLMKFVLTNKLGIKNYVVEYNLNQVEIDSMFDQNAPATYSVVKTSLSGTMNQVETEIQTGVSLEDVLRDIFGQTELDQINQIPDDKKVDEQIKGCNIKITKL